MKKYAFVTFILVLSLGAFVGFGQGCGESWEPAGDSSSLGGPGGPTPPDGECSVDDADLIDKEYTVQVGERTVSIAYGSQMLDSFLSCTGVGDPSQRTMDEFASRNQSLSEYGSLTDVSAAQMMATTALAAEVCQDLINKEKSQAAGERFIFTSVNLDGAGLSFAEIESSVELLALSCWQRNSLDAEEMDIINGISQMNLNSEVGALSLCTSMLSSLSAIEQ